jgi:hypothetical protein
MFEIENHIASFEDALCEGGGFAEALRLKWCRAAYLQGSAIDPADILTAVMVEFYKR